MFGLIVAWVLVRYRFPGKRLVDALVDLPFALPTAVSGIALTALYAPNGWIGQSAGAAGHQGGLHAAGRDRRADLHRPAVRRAHACSRRWRTSTAKLEEAAASLGASRWQTFRRVILPIVLPALLTGFALAFARALGEYGSVVFISGNMPMKTEITPLLIITKLEQYDYAGATAIAVVMLVASFVLLLAINLLQWWSRPRLCDEDVNACADGTIPTPRSRGATRGHDRAAVGPLAADRRGAGCSSALFLVAAAGRRCSPRRFGKGLAAYLASLPRAGRAGRPSG